MHFLKKSLDSCFVALNLYRNLGDFGCRGSMNLVLMGIGENYCVEGMLTIFSSER